MKARRFYTEAELRKIGTPLEDVIAEHMKDPAYRRAHERYSLRIDLAALVKILRLENKLTQKQLAARAGVPQSQIARLEGLKDERVPSLPQLVRIFTALGRSAVLSVRPKATAKGDVKEVDLTPSFDVGSLAAASRLRQGL